MTGSRADLVVIGGGIAGWSAAYRAAAGGAGAAVVLVDRGDAGQATAAGAGIVAPGASGRDLPGYLALATPAVRFYPELIQQLAADGEAGTGYETCGALVVATNQEEAARLPEIERLFRARAAAGVPNMGEIRRLSGAEARALFPPLAEVPGAIHLAEGARVD
jgi:D-amino-acid dehydrogenase